MTQDEIIEMARQVRVDEIKVGGMLAGLHFHPKDLMDFAKLVAAKEREACAKICDEFCYGSTKILVEKAIRARGKA